MNTPTSPSLVDAGRKPGIEWALIIVGLICFALQAWASFCLFPLHAWNDVRLRPSFLLAEGLPLYPGIHDGPITTWMYGPAHPLWFYPVTWLRDVDSVYLAGAAWNITGYVLSMAAMCFLWSGQAGAGIRGKLLALSVCLLLIPGAYLRFLQADNVVLICGLLSLTCLSRYLDKPSPLTLWLAALCAATAAFAKAHGGAVIAGEWAGLALLCGLRGAWPLIWRTVIACIGWGLATLAMAASPRAAWEHLVLIPGRLPWDADLLQRTLDLKVELLLMVALPALLVAILCKCKQIVRGENIAVWVWIFSLPIGLAGAFKTGGSSNSLHGVFFLLPVVLFLVRRNTGLPWTRYLLPAGLVALNLFPTWRSVSAEPTRPMLSKVHQAVYLARGVDHHLWLPWRPLVTYLVNGRHDHDEDGLYVRQVTGFFPSRKQVADNLPPEWTLTATEYPGMFWGISTAMQPEGAKTETLNGWLIYTVSDGPPEGTKLDSKNDQ